MRQSSLGDLLIAEGNIVASQAKLSQKESTKLLEIIREYNLKAKMSDKSKLIMETIALVRSRKARPDLDRISMAMQRNHNVDPKDTERWLDMLCEKGIVARRPFKGAVSYRIVADEKAGAAKAHARYFRNAKKIAKAIHDLDPHGLGVSLNAIERFVSTHWRTTCSILSLRVRLRSVLRDGIEEGRFIKTVNGCYKLGTAQPTDPLEVSISAYNFLLKFVDEIKF